MIVEARPGVGNGSSAKSRRKTLQEVLAAGARGKLGSRHTNFLANSARCSAQCGLIAGFFTREQLGSLGWSQKSGLQVRTWSVKCTVAPRVCCYFILVMEIQVLKASLSPFLWSVTRAQSSGDLDEGFFLLLYRFSYLPRGLPSFGGCPWVVRVAFRKSFPVFLTVMRA